MQIPFYVHFIYDTKNDSPTKLKHQKNVYRKIHPQNIIEGWSTVTGSFKSNYEKKVHSIENIKMHKCDIWQTGQTGEMFLDF